MKTKRYYPRSRTRTANKYPQFNPNKTGSRQFKDTLPKPLTDSSLFVRSDSLDGRYIRRDAAVRHLERMIESTATTDYQGAELTYTLYRLKNAPVPR